MQKLLTVYTKGHSIKISTAVASQRSDRGGTTTLISSNQHNSHPCIFQGLTAQEPIMHLLLASAVGAVLIRCLTWSEHDGERIPTLLSREFMRPAECIYSELFLLVLLTLALGDMGFDDIGLVAYRMSVMEWTRKCIRGHLQISRSIPKTRGLLASRSTRAPLFQLSSWRGSLANSLPNAWQIHVWRRKSKWSCSHEVQRSKNVPRIMVMAM